MTTTCFTKFRLTINAQKIIAFLFVQYQTHTAQIFLNDHLLLWSISIKYFEIHFDKICLHFNLHAIETIKKVSKIRDIFLFYS